VLTSPEGDERASADGSNMENSFEPGGIFYRLLRADSTRWVSKGAGFLEPFGAEEPSLADLKDEVEELRHRLAESQRSTEERKALFVRQLNKLRLERDSLLARVEALEQKLAEAREGSTKLALTRAQKVRRGLAAASPLVAAAGVVKLALSLRQAFEHRGRRLRSFRLKHA
jgi:hypothetical protein